MRQVRLKRVALFGTLGIVALSFARYSDRPDQPAGGPPAQAKSPEAQLPEARQVQWGGFTKTVQPFLEKNCTSCHGGEKPEANIRLEFSDLDVVEKKAHVLTDALRMLRQHKMPPSDQDQPRAEELKPVVAWLGDFALQVDAADLKNPGHITMRRLNRSEYNNTIRDLLAIDIRPADAFPEDDVGFGFDNNGDILSLAPVLMDKYIAAAELSLDHAIKVKASVPPPVQTWDAGPMEGTPPKVAATAPAAAGAPVAAAGARGAGRGAGRGPAPQGRVFSYNGDIHIEQVFEKTGHYVLKMRGYGVVAPGAGGGRGGFGGVGTAGAGRGPGGRGAGRPMVAFKLDGLDVGKPIAVLADYPQATVYGIEAPIEIKAGKHVVTLSFLNGATKQEADEAEASAAAATQNASTAPAVATAPAEIQGANGAGVRGGLGGQVGLGGQGGQLGRGRQGGFGGFGGRGGPAPSPTGKPKLGVLAMETEGPVDFSLERMPESFRKVITVMPSESVSRQEAAQRVIGDFAARAYRRPVTETEMQRLLAYWASVEKDETFENSIALALQPVLVSPNFLYRVEGEPTPNDAGGVRKVNDYELASRLSYFLWSSLPDDELTRLASQGKLHENLAAQVKRMLASPKIFAMCENFAGQWLQLRKLAGQQPDAKKFPQFDEDLRAAMLQETYLFFNAIIQEDRSVLDFLDSDFTFVNGRLAKYYGIANVTGDEFRRVSVTGTQRGGLLTEASVLTLTSYPNRTSPVLRGKWVLENMLDAAPPPPPPNIPTLEASNKDKTGLSLRQMMEVHRQNATCYSCHEAMDPIGLGMENFNAVGAWRETDPDAGNGKIDASGKLPDGQTFTGPAALKKILQGRKDEFTECLVGRMLTYALGRGMDEEDRPRVKMIAEALKKQDYRFSELIMQVVSNDAFQEQGKKRGNP